MGKLSRYGDAPDGQIPFFSRVSGVCYYADRASGDGGSSSGKPVRGGAAA